MRNTKTNVRNKLRKTVLAIAIFFFFFSDSNKLSFHFFQVDGEFTLNENVCDVDGLNVAAEAFSDLREASANDLVHLPNNPYTPQQLFFINTAQVRTTYASGRTEFGTKRAKF